MRYGQWFNRSGLPGSAASGDLPHALPDRHGAARGGVAEPLHDHEVEHPDARDGAPRRERPQHAHLPRGDQHRVGLPAGRAAALRSRVPGRRRPLRGERHVRGIPDGTGLVRRAVPRDGHQGPRRVGRGLPGADDQRPVLPGVRQSAAPAREQRGLGGRRRSAPLQGPPPLRRHVLPHRLREPDPDHPDPGDVHLPARERRRRADGGRRGVRGRRSVRLAHALRELHLRARGRPRDVRSAAARPEQQVGTRARRSRGTSCGSSPRRS